MKNDASDFGNPWSDEDGSSGGFAPSPEFENPWADAGATGDATGAGVGATATTTGSDSARSPDKEESSSAASKVPAILLVIALIIVGIWAFSSISSAKGDVGDLEAENARLKTETGKIPGLEADLEAARSNGRTAADQRNALVSAFGGINPCSVPGYGTPEGTFWVDTPEMGLGCAYVKNGKTTLVVTVASGAPISYGQFTENNGTKGYMVSSSDGNMAIYVWLAGSGSSTERKAHEVRTSLTE